LAATAARAASLTCGATMTSTNWRATIAAAVGERLRARGAEIREFRVERGRLDEVFRALTTGDSGSDEEARA
jgi:hypothetical protein